MGAWGFLILGVPVGVLTWKLQGPSQMATEHFVPGRLKPTLNPQAQTL